MMNYQILNIETKVVDDELYDSTGFYTKTTAHIKWRANDVEEFVPIKENSFSAAKEGVEAYVLEKISSYPEEVFSRIELPKEFRFVPLCEDQAIMGETGDVMSLTNEDAQDPNLHATIWASIKKGIPYVLLEQIYIELKTQKTQVYIGTAFTFNMVEDLNHIKTDAETITWEEMDAALFAMKKQHSEFIEVTNGMGHESTAQMLGEHAYRRSLSLKKGDILYIPQYRGPRLPEGETKLPEGALLVPIKVVIK